MLLLVLQVIFKDASQRFVRKYYYTYTSTLYLRLFPRSLFSFIETKLYPSPPKVIFGLALDLFKSIAFIA